MIWDSEKAQTDRLYWLGKNRDFVTKFSEMVDKNRQIGRFNRDKIVDFSAIFITWVFLKGDVISIASETVGTLKYKSKSY